MTSLIAVALVVVLTLLMLISAGVVLLLFQMRPLLTRYVERRLALMADRSEAQEELPMVPTSLRLLALEESEKLAQDKFIEQSQMIFRSLPVAMSEPARWERVEREMRDLWEIRT